MATGDKYEGNWLSGKKNGFGNFKNYVFRSLYIYKWRCL